jgi:cytochrome P450
MVAILKSADFAVVDYAASYAELERRLGIDWGALIDALHFIPLAREGRHHAELRRNFAQLINARSALAKAAVEEYLVETVPLVFRARRKAELVQELIRPATDVLFGALLGAPVPDAAADRPSVSQVFDRTLGLNRRKRMQNSVMRLSQVFANARELATSTEYATALIILGHDSLLSSLGVSLLAVLEGAGERRLCDLAHSDFLPRTGVPYVERVAQKDCAIGGFTFRAGDRARLYLDACPARGHADEEAPYFGMGRHSCLGKDLSQFAWRIVSQELVRLPLRVRIIETRVRANDYIFNMHERIEVSIYD